MVTTKWPYHGKPARGVNTKGIGYLDWYIPRLREKRKFDLSHSGLQFEWDFDSLIGEELSNVAKHHIIDKIDPREFIAQKEGISKDRVVVTHGATQALQVALLSVGHNLDQDKIIAVESPSYAPVSQTANLLGYSTIPVHRNPPESGFGHWRIDKNEWSNVLEKASVLMFTPILNPVGWDLHPDDRNWIIQTCKKNSVHIIADEVYSDSMVNHPDSVKIYDCGEHCISINSLTKVHGLGSIRFGWLIASESVAKQAQDVFRTVEGMISSPSVRLAKAVFNKLDQPVKKITELREKNLPLLRDLLQSHGIDWNEPEYGVFGAFKLPRERNSLEFVDDECVKESLLAVPGCMFSEDMKSWLRVAWSIEHEDFVKGIEALDKALNRIAL